MIVMEQIGKRERRHSDQNVMLRQIETGRLYEDATDIVPCPYTYEETDVSLAEEAEVQASDLKGALEELGVRL
jgi:hypothetical protein